jgi:hypothetical protein
MQFLFWPHKTDRRTEIYGEFLVQFRAGTCLKGACETEFLLTQSSAMKTLRHFLPEHANEAISNLSAGLPVFFEINDPIKTAGALPFPATL